MPALALPPVKIMRERDFSGALNLRDAQSELGRNESPFEWNCTHDERGGVGARLGYVKHNSNVYSSTAKVQNMHYSPTVQAEVVQCGASLFLGATSQYTYQTAVLADSPNGYWRLDDLTDTAAKAGVLTENAGPISSSASLVPNEASVARDLNGTTQYYTAADGPFTDLGDVFTLEAWVRIDGLPGAGLVDRLFDKGTNGYALNITETGAFSLAKAGASVLVTSTSTMTVGQTYHLAATKNGATVKLYLNGVDVTGVVTNATMLDTATALTIGRSATAASSFVDGVIDEVAIYPTALSPERVRVHALGPRPVKTFTTDARVGFADFAGKLCVIHPIDGLFTSTDGITYAAVADVDAPKGNVLFPWQNKLLAAGNPTNKARVTWSAAGDPAVWASTDFNDLREKDSEQVIALAGAAGVDIAGRPGVLAFKRESFYRIYDSATGAYQTVDTRVGAASALSVVSHLGRTIFVSQQGLFFTDGIGQAQAAGDREEPLWTPEQIAFDKLDNSCAGWRGNRVYFSLTRQGGTVNNLAFEYHPQQGWLSPRSDATSCYCTYGLNDQKLLGGSPTVNGQAYRLLKGGSDDGAAIASKFQTRWFEPADGILASLLKLKLLARGAANLYVRQDYETGSGELFTFSVGDESVSQYGVNNYDDPLFVYGPSAYEDYEEIPLNLSARAFSMRVEALTTTSASAPQLLESGSAPEIGAWGIYGFDVDYVPLGLA